MVTIVKSISEYKTLVSGIFDTNIRVYEYIILNSMRFYDFAKTQCLHYTGWSRGVDSFLENLLKAKILYTRYWGVMGEEKPLVPQAPLSRLPIIINTDCFFL